MDNNPNRCVRCESLAVKHRILDEQDGDFPAGHAGLYCAPCFSKTMASVQPKCERCGQYGEDVVQYRDAKGSWPIGLGGSFCLSCMRTLVVLELSSADNPAAAQVLSVTKRAHELLRG
jgi:hypothetical protein